jgi:ABC-type uncharacterized transport system permease subunit
MVVMWGANALLSGYFLTIEFYPGWLAAFARSMPFPSIIYTPAAIYAGQLSGGAALAGVGVQIVWAVLLLGTGRALFEAARRRLVVQGG